MAEIKHVGRVIATNKKCLVAYRTLPGDASFCLIIPTENLPDIYHDAIINLVESQTGQDANEFADALARSQFPDGNNMLRSLHGSNRLIKAPTSAIEMLPAPGTSIVLSELNQMIAEMRGVTVDDLSIKESFEKKVEEPKATATVKETPAIVNAKVIPTTFESPEAEAKFYRSQADKLAKEAANFRRKAEELAPTKKKA
jgi:hypothetical protein